MRATGALSSPLAAAVFARQRFELYAHAIARNGNLPATPER